MKKQCLLWAQVSDFNSVKVGVFTIYDVFYIVLDISVITDMA